MDENGDSPNSPSRPAGGSAPTSASPSDDREDLVRALDAALHAARGQAEFLANMSHELRTPLTAVLGFADALRKVELPPPAQDYVRHILASGRLLLQSVNDILAYSALEDGGVAVVEQVVDLDLLLADLESAFRPNAAAAGLAFRVRRDPQTPKRILSDPGRIQQILTNLVGNAVKFTTEGTVEVVARRDAAERLELAVFDTGPGIAPHDIPRLFKRFSQLENGRRRGPGGTGLGLAISQGVAHALGGEIRVQSKPGQGSAFILVLPAKPVPKAANDGAPPTPENAALAPMRLLVADDNPANRALIEVVLAPFCSRLVTAPDGEEAVRLSAEEKFDAIVLDVRMPGIDGLEACRLIRNGESPNRRTPVIALSADVMPQEIARTAAAGMVAHVAKPIDLSVLVATLQTAIANAAQGDAPRA